jgi:hypothetical protein
MSKLAKPLFFLVLAFPLSSWAQTASSVGTPVQIVVTLGHHYGREAAPLTLDNITVTQGYEPLSVTKLVPLKGDQAGLELFLLVDNYSNCEPGSKFEELRRFIVSQPSTTAVGVAYIDNGLLKMVQSPTQDRDRAVAALSTPAGSNPASPFSALAELIQGWRQGPTRRVVVLISNGIDPAAPDSPPNPSTEAAIQAAQRAGVTVYAIYHPSADYLSIDMGKAYAGQVQLAHMASETGGEAYFLNFGPLPSLAPFLTDMANHLEHQYLVEILAIPESEDGAFEQITVTSTNADVDLTAPDKAWVPGRKSTPSNHRTLQKAPAANR